MCVSGAVVGTEPSVETDPGPTDVGKVVYDDPPLTWLPLFLCPTSKKVYGKGPALLFDTVTSPQCLPSSLSRLELPVRRSYPRTGLSTLPVIRFRPRDSISTCIYRTLGIQVRLLYLVTVGVGRQDGPSRRPGLQRESFGITQGLVRLT